MGQPLPKLASLFPVSGFFSSKDLWVFLNKSIWNADISSTEWISELIYRVNIRVKKVVLSLPHPLRTRWYKTGGHVSSKTRQSDFPEYAPLGNWCQFVYCLLIPSPPVSSCFPCNTILFHSWFAREGMGEMERMWDAFSMTAVQRVINNTVSNAIRQGKIQW